jgi:hypothetical protein
VGAVTRGAYLGALARAGLTDANVLGVIDYFQASPSEATRRVAASLGAKAMVLTAAKPG